MGLSAIPYLFHTGLRTPGRWGNKTKGIKIFSILVKCIHVWFVLARVDCWLIGHVITLFWSWCDLVCHDKQWFLNNEGNIFWKICAIKLLCITFQDFPKTRSLVIFFWFKRPCIIVDSRRHSRGKYWPPLHEAKVKFPAVCCFALTRPHGVTCRKTYMWLIKETIFAEIVLKVNHINPLNTELNPICQ